MSQEIWKVAAKVKRVVRELLYFLFKLPEILIENLENEAFSQRLTIVLMRNFMAFGTRSRDINQGLCQMF